MSEEEISIDKSTIEQYQYNETKSKVLIEKVEIPKNWNDILFLIGRFITQNDILDEEILVNVFISQQYLFPKDSTKQLQAYIKQIENSYFENIHKIYVNNLLINKIKNNVSFYALKDEKLVTFNTLKLAKFTIQKALNKNKNHSKLPLLSFPTHKPYWVEPKVLLERIIQYQNTNEEIDNVDLSIAISRMPRENVEEALPLLDKINGDLKDLMSYCLGKTNNLKISSSSKITNWFKNLIGQNLELEKLALWAVAARTFYPELNFEEFEKTNLKDIPFVAIPYSTEIKFEEKWNEYRDYQTKEIEKSPSWFELSFPLPKKKEVPKNFIYNLDLHPKKERSRWYSDFVLNSDSNVFYWNSIMPQNNQPLALQVLKDSCKTANGSSSSRALTGFLNVMNSSYFKFDDVSILVLACSFFQEKKEIRILASEVLIQIINYQNIDIELFTEKMNLLITNKYGVFQRFIDGIIAIKDISALHNSALYLVLDGIFSKIKFKDKLPTNFKKLVENYTDVLVKSNNKPSKNSILFFEKHKDNSSLKSLIKHIIS